METEGMYICERPQTNNAVGDYTFECSFGIYIYYLLVCDGKEDCPGEVSTDEVGCECNSTLNYSSKCKVINIQNKGECSDFYFKTWTGICKPYDFSLASDNKLKLLTKSLANQRQLHQQQSIIQKRGKLSCGSNNFSDHTFYEISEICSYKLNSQGHLIPCNKGGHLQNCEKFECNMMFKCPDFYCIPWSYTCDGKWDCPSGYDESIYHKCENRTCGNMFKCKMSSVCLHLGDVCNGEFECPYQDDESLCLLKDTTCPSECQCLAFAIRCYSTYIAKDTLPIYFPYISATLVNSKLYSEDKLKTVLLFVSFLSITNTNFKNICPVVYFMKHVITLDVSKNAISEVKTHCFKNKFGLRLIKLNDNMIQHVEKFSFYNLSTLLYIDLSNNDLSLVYKHSIVGSENLFFLSLENNTLEAVRSKDIFNELNIKFLRINCFSLCCYVKSIVKCSVKKPWYISCSHLLGNNVIKYTFYFMSFAIIGINILHLLLQSRHEENKQSSQTSETFDTIVISINIVNMIDTIPLLILLISDLHYGDNIVLVQNQWRSSIMCLISGGINIYYGIASPFLHNLLSYARYEVVKNPIDSNFKRNDYIIKIIIVGCTFSLFFATVIAILFWLKSGKDA